ncbi:DUF4138 domain-containing protein [Pedobacter sp. GR22-6]|uniref:DUF4138 domain-containing protein n=1 Tax=Pedobacter sp. GR22-6 TaxID=3127957 RepID=UPI00307FA906
MKLLFLTVVFICTALFSYTQQLPVVLLPGLSTFHFISPEPIQYVDISTKGIVADLPLKNVLRIKRVPDSLKKGADLSSGAVVTIAGEKFLASFRVAFSEELPGREFLTQIEILPGHMRPLELSGLSLSKNQLRNLAAQMLAKKKQKNIAHSQAFDIRGNINHLSTMGDYVFLDIGYTNFSNLRFDTDEIRFMIEDEKINKASTVQSVEIKPEFVLLSHPAFKRNYRNVFVFRKFSFPGHKLLKIELSEKQISGRVIELKLKYRDVLEADVL